MQRLIRTAVCFACTLSTYWLYALLAVPWIEPPVTEPPNGRFQTATYQAVQRIDLTRIFPPGAWELDGAKVLETNGGVLIFKNWSPSGDDQIKIHPVTLLLFTDEERPRTSAEAGHSDSGGDSSEQAPVRPIVLRAPEGAVLDMEGATNPNQAQFGTPTGGRLLGDVTITREASAGRDGAIQDDAMWIATRNVQIDEQRVWTPHDIEFRYGRSFGKGRDLEITLLAEGTKRNEFDAGIGSVESLKLVHIDHLVLESPPRESSTTSVSGAGGVADPTSELGEGPVEVTAAGPFRFDFRKYRASFEEQVRIVRPQGMLRDQLTCDRFAIYFRRPGSPASEGDWGSEVVRIVAEGDVTLDAPSSQTTAECDHLQYEFDEGRFLLRGEQPVSLQHDKFQIEASHLEYILHPTDARRPGELWASGPGRLQTLVGKKSPRQFTARWHDMLRMQPQSQSHPEQQNHVISLYGKAFVAYQDVGQFAADDLHLYVWEIAEPSAEEEATPDYRIVPDRMLARGGVRFDSPQVVGQTEEVNVWFRSPDHAADRLRAGDPLHPDRHSRLPTSEPLAKRPLERSGEAAGDPKNTPSQRIRVEGNLLQLLVSLDEQSKATIEDLTISGEVTVRQPADPAWPARLMLQGTTIQMSDVGTPHARGRVVGNPARVTAEGNQIETRTIQVFQGANEIRVETPGSMTLPLDPSRDAESGSRRGRVTVQWQEGMTFNGLQASFSGGVTIEGTAEMDRDEFARFSGTSREMIVTMTRRIDFEQPPESLEKKLGQAEPAPPRPVEPRPVEPRPVEFGASSAEDVDVELLELRGDVELVNRTFTRGRIVADGSPRQLSYDRLESPRLTFHQGTQQIEALGPGKAITVRPDKFLKGYARSGDSSPRSSPSPGPPSPPGPPENAPPTGKLVFIQVAFDNGLRGNLGDRQVQFYNRVHTIYGPVQDWSERLEPMRRGALGKEDVELHCERMEITEMRFQDDSWVEFEAAGNTRVEGRRFSARAHRMTYNQGKDLLILHSDGRNPATLEAQQRAGEKPKRLQAGKIHYSPRTRDVNLQDLRSLNLGPANSRR